MKSEKEIREHLTTKAEADSAFRAQLIADPKATVEAEFQVNVPDTIKLQVHEETATSVHLVLPPQGGRLTPDEMQAVSGAHSGGAGPHRSTSISHWGT